MQFETIAVVIFALALLVFMWTRRRVITDLQRQNHELGKQVEKLRLVAMRQRDEIDKLIQTAEQERRARQMATLSSIGSKHRDKPPTAPDWKDPDLARDPFKNTNLARQQREATSAPSRQYQAQACHERGGSFNGGPDYGRSDSCSGSASSSSDSGSSSSSDSGSSCSSD